MTTKEKREVIANDCRTHTYGKREAMYGNMKTKKTEEKKVSDTECYMGIYKGDRVIVNINSLGIHDYKKGDMGTVVGFDYDSKYQYKIHLDRSGEETMLSDDSFDLFRISEGCKYLAEVEVTITQHTRGDYYAMVRSDGGKSWASSITALKPITNKPIEMTLSQIEEKLGHKVKIVGACGNDK